MVLISLCRAIPGSASWARLVREAPRRRSGEDRVIVSSSDYASLTVVRSSADKAGIAEFAERVHADVVGVFLRIEKISKHVDVLAIK